MLSCDILGIGQAEKLRSKPRNRTQYREPATLNQELNLFLFLGHAICAGCLEMVESESEAGETQSPYSFPFLFCKLSYSVVTYFRPSQ